LSEATPMSRSQTRAEPPGARRALRKAGVARALPDGSLRAAPELRARNTLGQSGLWSHGVSGDLPIVLVRVVEENDLPLVRQVLQAQEVLAAQGLSAERRDPERAPGELPRRDAPGARLAARRRPVGGLSGQARRRLPLARRVDPAPEKVLLASVCARGRQRRPRRAGRSARPAGARAALRRRPARSSSRRGAHRSRRSGPRLRFDNGFGGFSEDGREYVIVLDGADETPLPWSNVLANPEFGSLLSSSGAATTWAVNSRENKLTPFALDPVSDRPRRRS